MPKRSSLASEAQRMARQASADMASLKRAMREAQDNLAGLHRMLKVPHTTPRRHTIKGSTTDPSLLLNLLGFGASSIISDALGGGIDTRLTLGSRYGSSGSTSASSGQLAAALAESVTRGQRNL